MISLDILDQYVSIDESMLYGFSSRCYVQLFRIHVVLLIKVLLVVYICSDCNEFSFVDYWNHAGPSSSNYDEGVSDIRERIEVYVDGFVGL